MDLRSVKRAIALESDRLKKRQKRSISCLDLSAWCMKTAVCIAILLQYDFAAAAEWLACKNRRGKQVAPDVPLASLKSEVTKYFLELPFGELVHWTDLATTPLQRNILATAVQWSEAERLKRHVRNCNLECGAPVPSCELIRCYNDRVAEHELAPLLPIVSPLVRPMGKFWCSKWRKRHGARIGFLRATEPVGPEEKREQATREYAWLNTIG